jgi:exonuclease SbcC
VRILAIRGKNLASLYGPFELPLDSGPIAEAGLFSISGPTGSGKSTLVDALCLALYGDTPRFDEKGKGVRPGRPDQAEDDLVDANDRRNLLSRGASEGLAEVDFEGMDGRRYRATWTVNRARGRADGRLQTPKRLLVDLETGAPLNATPGAVTDLATGLLGYTFNEFRRAVVLPQFEFRAFLDADAATRAGILERVTGTEIYTRLSRTAHALATSTKAELERLEARAGDVAPLLADARAALERQAAELAAAREVAAAALGAAEGEVRWLETERTLAAELRDGEAQVARAAEAAAAADPRRARLAEVERAEPLRALLEDARRCAADARDAADRERAAADALHAARADAVASLRQAERDAAAADARRKGALDWLAAQAAERPLAAEWPRWRGRLAALGVAHQDAARAEAAVEGAGKAAATAAQRRESAQAASARLAAGLAALDRAAREAQAAAGDDLAGLAARARDTAARVERLDALRPVLKEIAQAGAAGDLAARAATEAGSRLEGLGAEARALRERRVAADATLQTAREALRRFEAALDLDARRAELRDGEPCPLCGSDDHPYARHAPARSALAAQAQAVLEAEQALEALAREDRRLAATGAAEEKAAEQAARDRRRAEEALAQATARWRTGRSAAGAEGLPPNPVEPGDPTATQGALEAAIARATSERDAAAAAQSAALRQRALAETARDAFEAARREADGASAALSEARLAEERAATERTGAQERLRGAVAAQAALEAELEPALAFREGWRDAARREPEALARACEAVAIAHAARDRDVADADAALQRLALERESAAAAREAAASAPATSPGRGSLALPEAERRLVAARTRQEEAAAATAERGRRAAEAAAKLEVPLAALGIDRAGLEALLAHGPDWVTAERAALDRLERAVRDARSTRAERERKLGQLAASGRPPRDLDAATALAGAARAALEAATGAHAAAAVDLQADDRRRDAHAALGAQLAAARAEASRWGDLGALIGSHDGRELRIFAQGLALDALLTAANEHLRGLAPRYRLQRVPRRDLDLQVVDGDLGDEVRGVNGLSGGESFLVSLALALGLASLSTRRSQARTLFIDEGFGTLDRETLEQAMSAIDQLRSGNRLVGVISHVPELHERIGVKVTIERTSAGRSRLVLPT